jgi:hypothetical protein
LPLGVDHVGLAGLAHTDARDHVPDELEVDLGHRHAAAAGLQTHGEIGFGLLAEVHRADPRFAGLGVEECRIVGTIAIGIGGIHRKARDGEHLASLGIELGDVGHRRRLAQQLQEFDAALRGAFAAQLWQRCEGKLLLDALDELLDARRRRDGLFLLQAGQRGTILLIGRIQTDRPAGQQGTAHQRHDEQEISPEQPAATAVGDVVHGRGALLHGWRISPSGFWRGRV